MYHGRFKGTHYEAGYRYGQMVKKHGHVITSSPTFNITDEMIQFTKECLPIYKKLYPEVVEEIQGMSDGQGTELEVLCRILFSMYCFKPDNHCTCFAYADDNNIMLGRNSDFLVSIEKLYMNCLYKLEGGYSFNANTTAFVQMEDGMNEHGLAAGLTFIYPHIRKPGFNAGMMIRFILERCKTVDEAIEALRNIPAASAQTITLADKTGKIAIVESNPEKFVVLSPKNGHKYLGTANNFNSTEMKEYRSPKGHDDWRADERYQTVVNGFENSSESFSFEFAKDILSGKYGFICQYDRKKGADTVWFAIYDVKNSKIFRVEGNPKRKPFKEDIRKI